jgi:hypothetical protein
LRGRNPIELTRLPDRKLLRLPDRKVMVHRSDHPLRYVVEHPNSLVAGFPSRASSVPSNNTSALAIVRCPPGGGFQPMGCDTCDSEPTRPVAPGCTGTSRRMTGLAAALSKTPAWTSSRIRP